MEVFMAFVGNVANFAWEGAQAAQRAGNWLLDGPKNVLSNVDPLSDVLKLVQRVNEILGGPLKQIAEAFSRVTECLNARNFIGRISDIISGRLDVLKELSKIAYLFGDVASTAKWLSSINVLGSWVKDSTAQIATWGKEFNLLKGIGDVSCVTGALLSIADTVRQILKEVATGGYIQEGRLKLGLLLDHVLAVAYDTTKVAAAVLSNIPGVHVLFTTVSLAIGSSLSLAKFFKKTYWVEDNNGPREGGEGLGAAGIDSDDEGDDDLPGDIDAVAPLRINREPAAPAEQVEQGHN